MSASTITQPNGRSPESLERAVGYVGESWVEADNLRSSDPQLRAAAEQLESIEEIGALCQEVFELGVSVWAVSQSRQISADLSEQIDRFRADVDSLTTKAVDAITQQVSTVTEPSTGLLASAVEREAAGLKTAVAAAFDANDKTSALSRIEECVAGVATASQARTVEAVRQVLNPSAGSGPLADLRAQIVREISVPLQQVNTTVGQLKEMAAADKARQAEHALGTGQGAEYETEVAALLAKMGQSSGDVVTETGAQTGTMGNSKVGDHVIEIETGDGASVRVVYESKKHKSITVQKIRDELDQAAANRDASVAVMVLASNDTAPNRMPFQRLGTGRYTVVYDAENRDALALRVAYQQARADALALYRAGRSDGDSSVDLEALLSRIAEARSLLDQTTTIESTIRKAKSGLERTLVLGEKMRDDIRKTLDECQALIAVDS